jgi:hypothetical protein
MPKVSEVPEGLKAMVFHGVELGMATGDEVVGDCPLCGKEGKLYVNAESGLWSCKVCGAAGNSSSFLHQYWETCVGDTKETDLERLAKERGLRSTEVLSAWGVCKSVLSGEWLVPGHSASGQVAQLYRYCKDAASGKMKLMATPGLPHQLMGAGTYDPKKDEVCLCEGPWDGMALWEVLRTAKLTGDKLIVTGQPASSLYKKSNVLAVPGANVFSETWRPLFAGKRVWLLYDSDHPTVNPATKKPSDPAGLAGARHAAGVLGDGEGAPAEIGYLKWGPDGYDPDHLSGYDVRDLLTKADQNGSTSGASRNGHAASLHLTGVGERVERFGQLLSLLVPVPSEWRKDGKKKGSPQLEPLECKQWDVLIHAWRRALKWTEGLDRALSVMLAAVTSTRAVGDQLWCKIISPPSGGKSTLCEAISVNRQYVLAKSTIRGFHSGFGTDKGEDNSLIAKLYDKTLVTKDGDTLLQQPNLGQILAEARDLYDSTSRTHYRNRMSRDYQGVRMTWLLCGTSSLRQIDSSELGERFLDCVIMDGIDEELEDEILLRVASKAERSLSYEANGKAEGQHDPDLVKAMRLSGGYVGYLRDHAHRLLPAVAFPQEGLNTCIRLGKFVAYMRARPSLKQEETAEREFAARLVSQHVRLAKCLAVVLNRKKVDEEVMRRVKRVALDTARGRTLELARHLYAAGTNGIEARAVALLCGETPEKATTLLRFLRRIGASEPHHYRIATGVKSQVRWRLTLRLRELWREVVGEPRPATLFGGEE